MLDQLLALLRAMSSRETGLDEMLPISEKTHCCVHGLLLLPLRLQAVGLSPYHAQAPHFANTSAITAGKKRFK